MVDDYNIFRVDPQALREAQQQELKRLVQETLKLQSLKTSKSLTQPFYGKILSFPETMRIYPATAGEGRFHILSIQVPPGSTGFLQSFGNAPVTFLDNSGNTVCYYEILIDNKPIEGYSNSQGRIDRQIGTFNVPLGLVPPLIFKRQIEVFGTDNRTSGNTLRFGIVVEGIFAEASPLGLDGFITPQDVRNIVRSDV